MGIWPRQRDHGEPLRARPANNDDAKDHKGGPKAQPDLMSILIDLEDMGIRTKPEVANPYREGRDYTLKVYEDW